MLHVYKRTKNTANGWELVARVDEVSRDVFKPQAPEPFDNVPKRILLVLLAFARSRDVSEDVLNGGFHRAGLTLGTTQQQSTLKKAVTEWIQDQCNLPQNAQVIERPRDGTKRWALTTSMVKLEVVSGDSSTLATLSDSPRTSIQVSRPRVPPGSVGTGQAIIVPGIGEFVYVPRGVVSLGTENGRPDTRALHVMGLTPMAPFLIGRRLVDENFFNQIQGTPGSRSFIAGVTRRRVLSWLDAVRSKYLYNVRLPTEAEWEYAAKGPVRIDEQSPDYDSVTGNRFPWGPEDTPDHQDWPYSAWQDADKADSDEERLLCRPRMPTEGYNISWCGALDMCGVAWQMTSDPYLTQDPTQIVPPHSAHAGSSDIPMGSPRFFTLRGGAEPHKDQNWTSIADPDRPGFRVFRPTPTFERGANRMDHANWCDSFRLALSIDTSFLWSWFDIRWFSRDEVHRKDRRAPASLFAASEQLVWWRAGGSPDHQRPWWMKGTWINNAKLTGQVSVINARGEVMEHVHHLVGTPASGPAFPFDFPLAAKATRQASGGLGRLAWVDQIAFDELDGGKPRVLPDGKLRLAVATFCPIAGDAVVVAESHLTVEVAHLRCGVNEETSIPEVLLWFRRADWFVERDLWLRHGAAIDTELI